MPAHLKRRADRGGTYYLFDGDVKLSLETTKKGLAEFKLEQYIKDKNSPKPISTPTVKSISIRGSKPNLSRSIAAPRPGTTASILAATSCRSSGISSYHRSALRT
jgi:hypothetical protein